MMNFALGPIWPLFQGVRLNLIRLKQRIVAERVNALGSAAVHQFFSDQLVFCLYTCPHGFETDLYVTNKLKVFQLDRDVLFMRVRISLNNVSFMVCSMVNSTLWVNYAYFCYQSVQLGSRIAMLVG